MKISRKSIYPVLMSVLLIATAYIGIPLNGGEKGWLHANDALRYLLQWNFPEEMILRKTLFVIAAMSAFVLHLIPFLICTKYRKYALYLLPATFLLSTTAWFPPFIILCVPFIIVWVIMIIYFYHSSKKSTRLAN